MLGTPQAVEDPITLTTDNSPPTSHVVSRSRLVALSPFFKDMLSLPSVGSPELGQPTTIPMTESFAELEGILRIFKGEENALEELDGDDWVNVVRMADKYDCKLARREAVLHMWRFIGLGRFGDAFPVAVELEDLAAIQATWAEAAEDEIHLELENTAWKQRFTSSIAKRKEMVQKSLVTYFPDFEDNYDCDCDSSPRSSLWQLVAFRLMLACKFTPSFENQFRNELKKVAKEHGWNICYLCTEEIIEGGRRTDRALPQKLDLGDS